MDLLHSVMEDVRVKLGEWKKKKKKKQELCPLVHALLFQK